MYWTFASFYQSLGISEVAPKVLLLEHEPFHSFSISEIN
jgi:hypothetical protein